MGLGASICRSPIMGGVSCVAGNCIPVVVVVGLLQASLPVGGRGSSATPADSHQKREALGRGRSDRRGDGGLGAELGLKTSDEVADQLRGDLVD